MNTIQCEICGLDISNMRCARRYCNDCSKIVMSCRSLIMKEVNPVLSEQARELARAMRKAKELLVNKLEDK